MERRQQEFDDTGHLPPLSELASPRAARNQLHAHAEPSEADRQRLAANEPATLANQFLWLFAAGFDEVECFSRDRAGVLVGAFRGRGGH